MLRFRSFAPGKILAEGQKTVLREFVRTDVDRWLEWPRHVDPLFHLFNPPPMSARQRDAYWANHRQSSASRQFAVDDLSGAGKCLCPVWSRHRHDHRRFRQRHDPDPVLRRGCT